MIEHEEQLGNWIGRTVEQVLQHRDDAGQLREELNQEGWIIALTALKTFEDGRGASLQSWIITHLKRDLVRWIEHNCTTVPQIDFEELLDEDGIDELMDYDEGERVQVQVDMYNLVSKLPERDAIVVEQFYLNDLSEQEIADILGISRSMVQKIRMRAVANLQQLAGYQ